MGTEADQNCPACDSRRHSQSLLGKGRFHRFEWLFRACLRCGSEYCVPMPPDDLLDSLYGPEYHQLHYGGACANDYLDELDRTVARIAALKPGGRVLDLGCGSGRFLLAAEHLGLSALGFERTREAAAAVEQLSGVSVRSGSTETIEERFDAVHMADLLEHLPDPLQTLLEAKRLLRPNGLIAARGPLESQPNLFRACMRARRRLVVLVRDPPPVSMPPHHVVLFTLEGWHRLLARANLKIAVEEVGEVRWPAPPSRSITLVSVLKSISMLLSRSAGGRKLLLGNRVISILTPDDERLTT